MVPISVGYPELTDCALAKSENARGALEGELVWTRREGSYSKLHSPFQHSRMQANEPRRTAQ